MWDKKEIIVREKEIIVREVLFDYKILWSFAASTSANIGRRLFNIFISDSDADFWLGNDFEF